MTDFFLYLMASILLCVISLIAISAGAWVVVFLLDKALERYRQMRRRLQ
ncbi:MAG: hypothetical protein HUK09_02595 [Bacteroidaceae bacterium]|nr:hypothetical protein [Bacteroidaceae bacterium]